MFCTELLLSNRLRFSNTLCFCDGLRFDDGFGVCFLLHGQWFAAEQGKVAFIQVLFHPGRALARGGRKSQQPIVEDRGDRLPPSIQQLHLQRRPLTSVAPFQPQSRLVVNEKAVSVQTDAEAPALIAIPQVLQGSIPEQPVHQKRLVAGFCCAPDRYQPGIVSTRLCGSNLLPKVQPALDRCPWGAHRLTPWVGRPRTHAMAPGGKVLETQAHLAIQLFTDPNGPLPIDLDSHMGPDPKVTGITQGPVLDLQHQLNSVSPGHRAAIRAEQTQRRSMLIQLSAQLFDSSRWGHFLQRRAGGPVRS